MTFPFSGQTNQRSHSIKHLSVQLSQEIQRQGQKVPALSATQASVHEKLDTYPAPTQATEHQAGQNTEGG